MKNNKGISLILTLLIMSSLLTGAVIVGDILIRHGQVIQGSEVSEIAYFSARTGIEKTAYQVLKNYTDITSFSLDESLSEGGDYTIESSDIVAYTTNPNTGGEINNLNPWTISLAPGETFHLGLDLNGATYPTSINFSKLGSVSSDMVVFECSTTNGECSSNEAQSFDVDFSYTLDTSSYKSKNYEISIKNSGNATESYTIEPNNAPLPIGIQVSSKGVYSGYERRVKATFRKWQIYGD